MSEAISEERIAGFQSHLRVGDRVRHVNPKGLHCGSGIYPYAIVVSVEPLVLASSRGDMLWTCTIEAKDLVPEGRAELLELYSAVGRYAIERGFTDVG